MLRVQNLLLKVQNQVEVLGRMGNRMRGSQGMENNDDDDDDRKLCKRKIYGGKW